MSEPKTLTGKTKIDTKDVSLYIDSDGMVTDQHGYHVCHVDLDAKTIWVNVAISDQAFDENSGDIIEHLTHCFDEHYRNEWIERGFTEEYADWCTFHYKDGSTDKAWQYTLSLECSKDAELREMLSWVFSQELNLTV